MVTGSSVERDYPPGPRESLRRSVGRKSEWQQGNLIDWIRSKAAENDQVLLCGKYPVPLSKLIHIENDRCRFDVDVIDAVFIEK
jgi:hypothetical protein